MVTSHPLDPAERAAVREWLVSPSEMDGFFSQSGADQRHGYGSALHVLGVAPARTDLVRAALLHDIGKRHARLGTLGRSAASIAIRLGLPLPAGWALYRDHGALSAAELAGAEPAVVEFARHHHGERPATITPADWQILVRADGARIGR